MKWWVTSLIHQSVIADKNLTPQQTYSTNKLSPFWHYCSRKTVTTGCDTPTCIKDATDRITVLEYTNTSGTLHGSLLRGAISHPCCFTTRNFLPVLIYANTKHESPQTYFLIGFLIEFVPVVHFHLEKVGWWQHFVIPWQMVPLIFPVEMLNKNSFYITCYSTSLTQLT